VKGRSVLLMALLAIPLRAFANVPHLINLEARLVDANGNPIQTATQVEFDLYQGGSATSAGSGTPVYQEIATITPASDGTYSYLFGSGSPLNGTQLTSADFDTTQSMYLQIDINNQVILPRLQIVSQAWALMAENVIDGAITTTQLAANAVTTANISTGAVTSAQLDPTTVSNYLVPSGAIMMFTGTCPANWTRFSALDNLFPMGNPNYGTTGGSATHSHNVSGNTSTASLSGQTNYYTSDFQVTDGECTIGIGSDSALTNPTSTSQHTHTISGTTDTQSNIPPYMTVPEELMKPMPIKLILFHIAFGLGAPHVALGACNFAYQFDAGTGVLSSNKYQNRVILSPFSGKYSDGAYTDVMSYIAVSSANYTGCFFSSDHPLPVQVAPGSFSGTALVPSATPAMTLAWTDGTNGVPVQYLVYFGNDPLDLPEVSTATLTNFPEQGLAYGTNYFWKIDTVDIYGRDTWSAGTFSFSLVPGISHMYCAPNPFRAGSQTTTFIFNMSGPGSADMKIYALPHADLVFEQTLSNLVSGTNLWAYNGLDNSGRPLYNGVYLAILVTQGTQGNGKEKFKFLVVR